MRVYIYICVRLFFFIPLSIVRHLRERLGCGGIGDVWSEKKYIAGSLSFRSFVWCTHSMPGYATASRHAFKFRRYNRCFDDCLTVNGVTCSFLNGVCRPKNSPPRRATFSIAHASFLIDRSNDAHPIRTLKPNLHPLSKNLQFFVVSV